MNKDPTLKRYVPLVFVVFVLVILSVFVFIVGKQQQRLIFVEPADWYSAFLPTFAGQEDINCNKFLADLPCRYGDLVADPHHYPACAFMAYYCDENIDPSKFYSFVVDESRAFIQDPNIPATKISTVIVGYALRYYGGLPPDVKQEFCNNFHIYFKNNILEVNNLSLVNVYYSVLPLAYCGYTGDVNAICAYVCARRYAPKDCLSAFRADVMYVGCGCTENVHPLGDFCTEPYLADANALLSVLPEGVFTPSPTSSPAPRTRGSALG